MLGRMLDTFAPLMQMHDQMNRVFRDVFEDFFEDAPLSRPFGTGFPGLNFWEEGDNAYVEAELPGLGMGDIEVLVTGNQLTISGERKTEEPQGATWQRRERPTGRFSRTLTLPWEIEADKVEAKLHDGVLTVTLPKCESCKPKKVKVLTA